MAALRSLKVRDLMRRDHVTVSPEATLDRLRDRLRHAPLNELFVVDVDDRLVGTITLADLGEVAFDVSHDRELCAENLARRSPPVLAGVRRPTDGDPPLRRGRRGVCWAWSTTSTVPGWWAACTERDVMRAYNTALVNLRAEEHGETP